MDDNRNRASHLTLVGHATGRSATRPGLGFPLPRRHRRLLVAGGTAAAVLLSGLSAGTAVQVTHNSSAEVSTADLGTR